jgi:hypothetical protein
MLTSDNWAMMLLVARADTISASRREWGNSVQSFEKANKSADYPLGVMNFIHALEICFQVANSCTNLGFSQDGGRVDLSKTLSASLIYKGLRMNLISAGSIPLDSTFNLVKKSSTGFWQIGTSFTINLSLQTYQFIS